MLWHSHGDTRAPRALPLSSYGDTRAPRALSQHGPGDTRGTWSITPARLRGRIPSFKSGHATPQLRRRAARRRAAVWKQRGVVRQPDPGTSPPQPGSFDHRDLEGASKPALQETAPTVLAAQGVPRVTARARAGHGAARIPSVLRARTAPRPPPPAAFLGADLVTAPSAGGPGSPLSHPGGENPAAPNLPKGGCVEVLGSGKAAPGASLQHHAAPAPGVEAKHGQVLGGSPVPAVVGMVRPWEILALGFFGAVQQLLVFHASFWGLAWQQNPNGSFQNPVINGKLTPWVLPFLL